jgi:hypothetical protein
MDWIAKEMTRTIIGMKSFLAADSKNGEGELE